MGPRSPRTVREPTDRPHYSLKTSITHNTTAFANSRRALALSPKTFQTLNTRALSELYDDMSSGREEKQSALRLPPEIVEMICHQLSNRDIKQLRLTCRFYSETAVLRLARVFISANPLNIEVFIAIARHESFRHLVTEIIWDDATLHEVPPQDTLEWEETNPEYVEDKLKVDYGVDWTGNVPRWFRKSCKDNLSALRFTRGYDADRPGHLARAQQQSCHLPVTEAWAYYEKLLEQQREVLGSQAHARAFEQYISSFPALQRVTVTPAAYGKVFNPLYETPLIRSFPRGFNCPMSRGWPVQDAGMPEPTPWDNTGFDWQGFRTVTSVLSQGKDGGRVSELRIDAHQVETGLNMLVFDDESNESFQHFEKLLARPGFRHLHLDLMVDDYDWQAKVFKKGLLKRALVNAANGQGLEHLHFGTNIEVPESGEEHRFYVPLHTLFDPAKFSRQRHFSLRRFYVNDSDLLSFLNAIPTLRTIELSSIAFMEGHGTFKTFLDQLRDKSGWADRIPRPKLRIGVEASTPYDTDEMRQVWLDAEVMEFIYGHGSNPFNDGPANVDNNMVKKGFGTIEDPFDPEFKRPNESRETLRRLGYLRLERAP